MRLTSETRELEKYRKMSEYLRDAVISNLNNIDQNAYNIILYPEDEGLWNLIIEGLSDISKSFKNLANHFRNRLKI